MTDVFVSAAWLDANRDDVRIVDVRDAWEFEGIGHVPGAVNVPFDTFRADGHAAVSGNGDPETAEAGTDEETATDDVARGMLPGAAAFATSLSEAGIGPDDRIVAYDDTHGVFAARFLVTAELYGHDRSRLHLLDGDFSAWTREFPTTTAAETVSRTDYDVSPPDRSVLVDRATVAAALSDPHTVVVDTREPGEYEAGHLPGAVQLDWMELVDEDDRGLRERSALTDLLSDRGVTPDRRVILYCNTARRISHTYLVLRHLGYDDLGFYEGSLTEWKAVGGDLVTGAEPGGE